MRGRFKLSSLDVNLSKAAATPIEAKTNTNLSRLIKEPRRLGQKTPHIHVSHEVSREERTTYVRDYATVCIYACIIGGATRKVRSLS